MPCTTRSQARLRGYQAAAEVFAIPELLEKIFYFLQADQLAIIQRVDKTFQTTIARSPTLQYALFLRPGPPSPGTSIYEPELNPILASDPQRLWYRLTFETPFGAKLLFRASLDTRLKTPEDAELFEDGQDLSQYLCLQFTGVDIIPRSWKTKEGPKGEPVTDISSGCWLDMQLSRPSYPVSVQLAYWSDDAKIQWGLRFFTITPQDVQVPGHQGVKTRAVTMRMILNEMERGFAQESPM